MLMVTSLEPIRDSLTLPLGCANETVHLDEWVELYLFSEVVDLGCTLLLVQADHGVFLAATLLVRLEKKPPLIDFFDLP